MICEKMVGTREGSVISKVTVYLENVNLKLQLEKVLVMMVAMENARRARES